MVSHTRKHRVFRKHTKKQRGGGKLGNVGAFGSLFAKRGGPPPVTVNAPPANALPEAVNDPLAKYRKMLKMGQPEGAIIQKMLTNGKNPKNLFPGYGPPNAPATKAPSGFTLDELRDLKDYVNRSEIVVRLSKLGLDPREIYPELSSEEITVIIEDYSKPRTVPVPVVVAAPISGQSMKNALVAALKGRSAINGKKQNISFFTDYTKQEQTDLNTIDSSKARIKEIEYAALPADKKSIKQAEERGQQIKDFQLKSILSLLKEKRDLEATVSALLTDKLKNKMDFVKGSTELMGFLEDKLGPLPRGWRVMVNSKKGELYYQHKYTQEAILDRPTIEGLPIELPEGWEMGEDEIDAWYVNTFTGKSQWQPPTEPAELFNTTGWTQTKNSDGSYVWYMPYNKNNSGKWYVMRNSDKTWYENPTNANGIKYNTPPF